MSDETATGIRTAAAGDPADQAWLRDLLAQDPLGDDWRLTDAELDARVEEQERFLVPWLLEDVEGDPWEGAPARTPPSTEVIAATPAGPELARLLGSLALDELPAAQLGEVVAGCDRLAAWAAGRGLRATDALAVRAGRWRGVGPGEEEVTAEVMAAAEIGAACAMSPAAARARVELARALRRLPRTWAELEAGRIDLLRARAVVEATAALSDEAAAAVEARVLGRAATQTIGQLRASLRRAAIAADPDAAEQQHQEQVRERGVWHEQLPHGMGRLEWIGPVEEVQATYTWITAKALAARAAGDGRTLAQCRSDVLADLGRHGLEAEDLPRQQGRRPQIGVVVSLSTLVGADDEPAELLGGGPITAAVARRIAAGGTWRRLLTDPCTGALTEVSAGTYEPPQEMRDFVVARDRTCRGIGCRRPADQCDLDHRVPHPRGPTAPDNLDARCRTEHRIKTFTDLRVEPDGEGGLVYTLPSGRRYHRPADPVLEHPGLVAGGPRTTSPAGDPAGEDVPPF